MIERHMLLQIYFFLSDWPMIYCNSQIQKSVMCYFGLAEIMQRTIKSKE